MARLDHRLIYQACKLATGAKAHAVYTCLHFYETARNPQVRARYERTLRQFVAEGNQLVAIRAESEFLRIRSRELQQISHSLAQKSLRLPVNTKRG
jgi:hypothetical protein